MKNISRHKVYLIIAATMFFINLFKVDFDDLSWTYNKTQYVSMLFSAIAFVLITILTRKK